MGIEIEDSPIAEIPELPPNADDAAEEETQKTTEALDDLVTPEEVDRLLKLAFDAWAFRERDDYYAMEADERARIAPDLATEINKFAHVRRILKSVARVGVWTELGYSVFRRLLYRRMKAKAAASDQEGGQAQYVRTAES